MPHRTAPQVPQNTAKKRTRAGARKARGQESPAPLKKCEIIGSCEPAGRAGTTVANIQIPIGCASPSRIAVSAGHGGPRNSASRTSEGLTLAKAVSLIEASDTAAQIGLPFNRHITLHWQTAGLGDDDAMTATTAFLKYLREWLGGETAYIWTRENGDGKGSHLHVLAHIPVGRRWRFALSRRWIESITGRLYRKGSIRTERIAGARNPISTLYAVNLQTVLDYVLKGAEPHAAAALGIEHKPGGRIIGKRCGTSRNIGQALRRSLTMTAKGGCLIHPRQ